MPARWLSFAFDLGNEKKFTFVFKFDISYPQRAGYPSLPQEFRSPEMILIKECHNFEYVARKVICLTPSCTGSFCQLVAPDQRLDRPLCLFLTTCLSHKITFCFANSQVKPMLTCCQEGPLTCGKFVINWCMLAFLAAAITSSIGTSLVLSP